MNEQNTMSRGISQQRSGSRKNTPMRDGMRVLLAAGPSQENNRLLHSTHELSPERAFGGLKARGRTKKLTPDQTAQWLSRVKEKYPSP